MVPAPSPDGRPSGRLQVIYLMGSGHTGSSVLGVALGNCKGFFYAGEIEEWLLTEGASHWGGAERTRFWESVRGQLGEIPAELRGGAANRSIERASAALRVGRLAARRRMQPAYRRLAGELLHAIARTAGAGAVIDSSHSPLRARELASVDGIELYLVYLVRNPQSVIGSYVRAISLHEVAERRARIIAANAGLWLTQLLSIIVFLRHPRARRVFMRHEQLLANPEGVLSELLERFGSSAPLPDLDALDVGIALEGSRLLRGRTVALERASPRATRWSRLTAVLQGPWELIFARLKPAVTADAAAQPGVLAGALASSAAPRGSPMKNA